MAVDAELLFADSGSNLTVAQMDEMLASEAKAVEDIEIPETPGINVPRETPSTGMKPMGKIPYEPMRPQLVEPFLAAEGTTLIYGKGGTGKGLVAVWLAGRLMERGFRVAVIDFEGRRGEWSRRCRDMGLDEDLLNTNLFYADPTDYGWEADKSNIYAAAESLRDDVAFWQAEYLIIDSYSAAAPITEDSMGGHKGAQAFYEALMTIEVTSCLVLAHVAGNSERFPKKPIGTVGIINFAREAWAVEKREEQDYWVDFETYKATHGYLPEYNFLELRCMKKNDGEMPKPQYFDFAFEPAPATGITVSQPEPPKVHLGDRVAAIIRRYDKALTTKEISDNYADEHGEAPNAGSLRATLNRDDRFVSTTDGAGNKTRWKTSEHRGYDE